MNSAFALVTNTGRLSEQNICFINVGVQLLRSVPRINDYFKFKQYGLMGQEGMTEICDEMANLFNATCDSPVSAGNLRVLVSSVSDKDYLNDGSQQDIGEFLVTIIHEIE